ncbi:EmrB/QacA subfamily drug resistance transporter [Pseudomonas nitritireducens]|uniref:EmrB/QacA subfamily drug resistance transporter n=1 Tax=Pseudomonas nitroreducens TaxID=46680 RepID=A0A7W7P201_PSENT|nr:MFS transporter [Pseudomonas nitritireducens]MBB4864005.1 EmrB/QacA subfamily drug resistance transporter [Pseudomonas nitritireducens]
MTALHNPRNLIALAAVCLSSMMFGLEISSVPASLPALERVLHGDFQDLQWVMNAYTIAVTSVLMAAGTLADRFGRKRLFVISLALFGLTSLLCGLASDMPTMIAGRFLQGAAGGVMLICQVAVLTSQFSDPAERVRAFAAWGVVFGVGLGFGPIIGSAIVALASWQWVFLVHGPLALLTLALAQYGAVESRDPDAERLDLGGMLTLSLAVLGTVFYITQGADMGFASPAALAILLLSGANLAAFVVIERRVAHPLFDFSVLRIRAFSGAMFASAGMNVSFWPLMIYLPVYYHGVLGYDDVKAGWSLLAYTLPTLLVPPIAERLAHRFQPGWVIPGGMFVIGAGFFLMLWGSSVDHASWLTLLPGCVLAGIGLGLTNTTVTNTSTAAVPTTRAGMASGIDMSARMISLAINIAVMGLILLWGVAAALHGVEDSEKLQLAARIASGRLGTDDPDTARAALVQGFGWVLGYGGVSAWLFAAGSFLTFGAHRRARPRLEAVRS